MAGREQGSRGGPHLAGHCQCLGPAEAARGEDFAVPSLLERAKVCAVQEDWASLDASARLQEAVGQACILTASRVLGLFPVAGNAMPAACSFITDSVTSDCMPGN